MSEPRVTCCRPFIRQYPSGRWWVHSKSCPESPEQKIQRVDAAVRPRRVRVPENPVLTSRLAAVVPLGSTLSGAECPAHPGQPRLTCSPCGELAHASRESM